ncbi:MAG: choice-of-anchor B family protein [Bacteroidota bacterium]
MMQRILAFAFLLSLSGTALLAQDSLNMYQIYHWEDPSIPPAVFVNNPYNEIWGWYDSTNQREYAIIGSSLGTHFFDITDESNVQQVDYVAGKADQMIHRDYKNKGHYLYAVADEFESSLQIFDMSTLPDSVSLVYDSDTLFQISHNVWVEGDRLYVCIPGQWGFNRTAGFGVYDISDPVNPIEIALYNEYGNIHDIYSRNDTVFLNAETSLYVLDMKDPLAPVTIANMVSYPFQGYNHSGWASEDGRYYVMADETWGMPLKLLDFNDYSDPVIRSYMFPSMDFNNRDTNAIAHNPIIKGDFVYSSYYYNGVYIFDISDPQFPQVAGFYDTYPAPNDQEYKGAWGVYPFLPSGRILASDMQTGLYVFGYTGPFQTSVEPEYSLSLNAYPNPMDDQLYLESPEPIANWELHLFDELGRSVLGQKGKNPRQVWELDLKQLSLPPGYYTLHMQSKQKHFYTKIIKRP